MRLMVIFTALLSTTLIHAGTLSQLTDAPHRTPQEKARDEYRHPVATLNFFDVQNVVVNYFRTVI